MRRLNGKTAIGGARGMEDRTARKILDSEREGAPMPAADVSRAKRTAADHIATEADKASRGK